MKKKLEMVLHTFKEKCVMKCDKTHQMGYLLVVCVVLFVSLLVWVCN